MTPQQQLASNVRRLRRQARISQLELGGRAGIHFTEVSRIERSARDARLSTIVKLARALDVAPADLLDGIR